MSPREQLAEAAGRVAAAGLVQGTAGNLSLRDGDTVLVTPSGVALAACAVDDVVRVAPDDGRVLEGRWQPTSEVALHLGVLADTGAAAVVHVHSPAATAVACVVDELPVLHYQQLGLGGVVRVAPYATFGSPELAAHVRAALEGRQAALMANHGAIAVGASLEQALEHVLLLEWLAELHLRASSLGTPRVLTARQQEDVVLAALARGYGAPQPTTDEETS